MADGTAVELRPIRATDAAELVRFHAGLSLDTTRLRYFSPHRWLSAAEVERLTVVDGHGRDAVVALHGADLVGVARYECVEPRTSAEVAFVVADDWQHHGIGRMLFDAIAERATAQGVTTLVADTLLENHHMIDLFDHSGWSVTRHWDRDVAHYELTRPECP